MSQLKIERLKKEVAKLEAKLVMQELQFDDNLTMVNNHWCDKFDMAVGMFESQAKQAGTITELRKWFEAWTNDLSDIDANDPNAGQQMDQIIEKHGFEFKRQKINITYQEVLQSNKRR